MLSIIIPETEIYDELNNEFVMFHQTEIQLEHSLISLSKWESKWKKPFLHEIEKRTHEELIDYIRCMSISKVSNPLVFELIKPSQFKEITNYIEDPMTATTFTDVGGSKNTEIITNEIIYYWMVTLNIPMECEKWHLNRLLTLIRVCSVKNAPEKQMSQNEIMKQNSELNRLRKQQLKTRG